MSENLVLLVQLQEQREFLLKSLRDLEQEHSLAI